MWRFEIDGWSASFREEAAYEQITLSSSPNTSLLDGLVEHIDPRNSWTGYLIAAGVVLSIGLALSEPSASSGLGLLARIVFWLAHVASALFLFELAQITLGRIAMLERLPPLLLVMAVGMVGAILFSAFNLLMLDRIAFLVGDPTDLETISIPGLMQELRDSGATSVLFWVLLNSPRLIMIAQQKDADAADDSSTEVTSVPTDVATTPTGASRALLDLLSRLPRRIGTDIVAISAELHYLRVYTRTGEALILMSFGRAIDALGVIPGQAIHRSHWIALAHVVILESDGNRMICRLDTGLELPVSRTHRARLRAALAGRDNKRVIEAAERIALGPNGIN
jgi:DNA-binding LytR/AlgR family response regulator